MGLPLGGGGCLGLMSPQETPTLSWDQDRKSNELRQASLGILAGTRPNSRNVIIWAKAAEALKPDWKVKNQLGDGE